MQAPQCSFFFLILFNRHPLEDLETDRFLLRPSKLVELCALRAA
jgi:hypothetical protein